MIREICKDEAFLAQKAEPAVPEDLPIAADLLETLEHHKAGCVGMAANMIGVNKRIIAFDNEGTYMVMFNPEIVKQSGPYQAEEGCLSLTGTRPARRWKSIKVRWQNEKFQERLKTFTGWTAQIIQHEIDHCEGIIIEREAVPYELAILSDTHGLLRPEVAELLKTADAILHGGDINKPGIVSSWSSTRPSTLSGATTTRIGGADSPRPHDHLGRRDLLHGPQQKRKFRQIWTAWMWWCSATPTSICWRRRKAFSG